MFVKMKQHYESILLGAGLFLLSIVVIPNLAGLILTTFHGAPVGDDYSAIKEFAMTDNWLAAALHSLANTGRYTQSITSSIAYGALGDKAPLLLPALIIVWLTLLIYAYAHLLLKKCALKNRFSIPVSILIALVAVSLVASLNRPLIGDGTWFSYQMLFFSSAIVTYSIPLLVVLSLVYILLLHGRLISKRRWLSLLLFSGSMYVISLSNETLPATVIAITPIILMANFIYHRRFVIKNKLSQYSLASASASLLALLTLYFSPASIKRRQLSATTSDTNIINAVIERTGQMLSNHVYKKGDIALIIAASLVITLLITLYSRTNIRQQITKHATLIGATLLASSFMALLVATTLLVIGYGPTTPIYPRTLMIHQVFYISGGILLSIGVWMTLLGWSRWGHYIRIISIVVAVAILAAATPGQLTRASSQITAAIQYKSAWSELDYQLRTTAREQSNKIIIVNPATAGIGDGFTLVCYGSNFEEQNWVHWVVQEYYGVKRICSNSAPVKWPY